MNTLQLAPGMVVADRYALISVLGTGGMAVVFEAHDQIIERRVALKILHKVEAAARFQREAKAASALHHPAVVKVFGIGTLPEGHPYIALEFIEGETLIDSINRVGRMPPERALTLLMPVVGALAEAHAVGIVHRDIKPSNLIVQRAAGQYESLRLLDFGIALMDEGNGERLTQTGEIFGTPEFMAPEQAVGKPVGPTADVWALGAVLYELLAGEPPFSGTHAPGILYKVVNEPMPPLPDDIPPELADLVGECLAKDQAYRPASASVLLSKMEGLLMREAPSLISNAALPVQPPQMLRPALTAPRQRPPSNRRRPVWIVSLAVMAFLGLFGIWWAMFRPAPSDTPERLTSTALQSAQGADHNTPSGSQFANGHAGSPGVQAVSKPSAPVVDAVMPPSLATVSAPSAAVVSAPPSVAAVSAPASSAPASSAPASKARRRVVTPSPPKARRLAAAQTHMNAGRYREALDWLKSHPGVGSATKRAKMEALARTAIDDQRRAQARKKAAAAAAAAPKDNAEARQARKLIQQLKQGGDCSTRKRLIIALGKLGQAAAIAPISKERNAVGFSNLCMKDTIDDALRAIRAAQR